MGRFDDDVMRIALIALLLLTSCGEDPDRARTKTAIHFAQQERDARAKAFKEDHDAVVGKIKASMAAKNWDDAALEASKWRLVGGEEIKGLEATIDAEKEKVFRAKQVEENKKNLAARLEMEKQQALIDKADRARRKKEGVRIGMTAEEVLMSSWGKPQSVNQSVYSFGVHEQWVYPGFQYLFFENGKLTAIHNKK